MALPAEIDVSFSTMAGDHVLLHNVPLEKRLNLLLAGERSKFPEYEEKIVFHGPVFSLGPPERPCKARTASSIAQAIREAFEEDTDEVLASGRVDVQVTWEERAIVSASQLLYQRMWKQMEEGLRKEPIVSSLPQWGSKSNLASSLKALVACAWRHLCVQDKMKDSVFGESFFMFFRYMDSEHFGTPDRKILLDRLWDCCYSPDDETSVTCFCLCLWLCHRANLSPCRLAKRTTSLKHSSSRTCRKKNTRTLKVQRFPFVEIVVCILESQGTHP